jgi:hypothetical protein
MMYKATDTGGIPASEMSCTATDCERDAVWVFLGDGGYFDGEAACDDPDHISEVQHEADANEEERCAGS